MANDRTVRPLGLLEQFSSSRHTLGFYHCLANTCIYTLKLPRGKADLAHLILRTLKDVILSTPSLCVGISGEDSKTPTFVSPPTMKVSNHLFWSPLSVSWREQAIDEHLKLVQQCHSQQWPDVQLLPPWILICSEISSSLDRVELAVTFAVHHAVGDGLSTIMLHSRLQSQLDDQLRGAEPHPDEFEDVVQLRDDITLPPPLEKLIDLKLSWPFFSKTLWNEFAPRSPFSAQPRLPYTGSLVMREPLETCMRTSTIKADSLKSVLAACKAKQTTLTTLIHALILIAVTKHHPCDSDTSFEAQTSISLRSYMNKTNRANELIGAYYTSHNYLITPSIVFDFLAATQTNNQKKIDERIWTLARDIRTSLHARLATLPNDDGVGLLPYVSDFKDWWLKKVGKARDVTWEVSNLGSIPGFLGPDPNGAAHENGCEITQSLLTQSANVAGPAFSVNLASVKNGCLAFSVCWQESVVEVELMEAVIEGLRDGLTGIAGRYEKETDRARLF